MTRYNHLRCFVYDDDVGTNLIWDGRLQRVVGMKYGNGYPGGHLGARLFLPGRAETFPQFQGTQLVKITSNAWLAWYGYISRTVFAWHPGAGQGFAMECVGPLAGILGGQRRDIRWVDRRLTDPPIAVVQAGAWEKWYPLGINADTTESVMRMAPRGGSGVGQGGTAFVNGDAYIVRYTSTHAMKSLGFGYETDFTSNSGTWKLELTDSSGTLLNGSLNGGATGSNFSITATTARQNNQTFVFDDNDVTTWDWRFIATSSFTWEDLPGDVFASIFNHEAHKNDITDGDPTLQTIHDDIQTEFSGRLSTSDAEVTDPGLSLVPFITTLGQPETAAVIYTRGTELGDGAGQLYALALYNMDSSNLPIVRIESYPALTSADYHLNGRDRILQGGVNAGRTWGADFGNYGWGVYTNEAGVPVIVTPDTDSALENTDSQSRWVRKDSPVLSVEHGLQSTAVDQVQRWITQHKDPGWTLSAAVGPYIFTHYRGRWPASRIQAGQVVQLRNFIQNLASPTDSNPYFVITRVDYDVASETARLSFGRLEDLPSERAREDLEKGQVIRQVI